MDSSHGKKQGGSHGGMGQRGVTRPMAMQGHGGSHHGGKQGGPHGEQQGGDDDHSKRGQHHHDSGHSDGGDHESHGHSGHGDPYSGQRRQMLAMHHKQTLWVYWSIIMLGVWTLLSPFTFGYLNEAQWVAPSGGRGVWFGDELHTGLRAWLMTWSDILSGVLLIVLGWRALKPNRPVSTWAACFVGVWMTFAPVLFWSPSAAAYYNDTFVGMLVIALTILIPGMPNMILYMKMGGNVPKGWSYNPSSWPQRWIMIVMGFAGLLVSRYLGAYQLGYISSAWDPFFGSSSQQVLDSKMSHSWPISDGSLGALAYTFEFLMGWMGAPSRWRTMPWMVTFFGILVIPLGLVHIALVISQPVVVGHWCTMCLLAAAIMLPMIPLEVDEVVAMCQHMVRARKRGDNLWQVFWKGGHEEGLDNDERSPELMELPGKPMQVFRASIWGISAPYGLLAAAVAGIASMFLPWAFGIGRPLASVYHIGGALTVVVSVIAMGEVLRLGRYLNVPLGLALALCPFLLGEAPMLAIAAAVVAGAIIVICSIPRGPKTESYGTWDRWVR